MLYETSIPIGQIAENEIRELVSKLASVTGQKVEIEQHFVISTDSQDLSSMLDTLALAIQDGKPVISTQKNLGGRRSKKRKRKAEKQDGVKKEPTRGPHIRSIRIIRTGEMISRYELEKHLREHAIEPGTALHSPKHGNLVVRNGGAEHEPYTWSPSGEVS